MGSGKEKHADNASSESHRSRAAIVLPSSLQKSSPHTHTRAHSKTKTQIAKQLAPHGCISSCDSTALGTNRWAYGPADCGGSCQRQTACAGQPHRARESTPNPTACSNGARVPHPTHAPPASSGRPPRDRASPPSAARCCHPVRNSNKQHSKHCEPCVYLPNSLLLCRSARAITPTKSIASACAPLSSRSRTVCRCPLWAARMRGVSFICVHTYVHMKRLRKCADKARK